MNGVRSGSVMVRPREGLAEVPLETRHFEDLGRYLLEPMTERVRVAQQYAGELLAGRTVWMVNSTALGGGVAQLLRTLLPYWKGTGIDVRWVVLLGSGEFFRVTKRFHNHLQGQPGDGDVLGIEELTTLDRAALYHAGALASLVAPGDVVVLNDPQTAAMSGPLQRAGATVIWSCHIGIDHDNEYSWNAWRCLRPRLASVRRFVFSRYTSLPEWLGGAETSILTPGIDPGSTKNLPMPDGAARAILQHLGLAAGVPAAAPAYDCTDGSTARLAARPTVLDSDGAPDWDRDPVVVSLARWDRIKDPLGILDGFLERALPATGAHLLLAGPDPGDVADDPEAQAVLAGVRERWQRLPPRARTRVHVACFPLTPPEESAAMVNAIQRLAAVVVKKSLQEGFGLGVTEAMWKARPVVASAVGAVWSRSSTGTAGCWSRTLPISGRSAMRSSSSWTNRSGPPGSARPRANGLALCSSTTCTSCAGWRSSARRSSRGPVPPGPRAPRRASQRTHGPLPPRSILATATR